MWGVTLFDGAETAESRRAFRTGRRRLDRRQHRITLLQELFAKEVAKTDEGFFEHIRKSALWRDDAGEPYSFFNDEGYTDADYHNEYPTIHHLIDELMRSDKKHDVRLVYLACAWLVAHRGHFLSDVSRENVAELRDFRRVYEALKLWFHDRDYALPVGMEKEQKLEEALKQKLSVSRKYESLKKNVLDGKKPDKNDDNAVIDAEVFYKMLCGSSVKLKDLFKKNEYEEVESFSLGSDDETLADRFSKVSDDDAQLLQIAKSVYDWSVLNDILQGKQTISEAKIAVYNQHKSDLKWLKDFIKKYSKKSYNELFRDDGNDSYTAYSHIASSAEGFFKNVKKLLEGITPEECDKNAYNDALSRLEVGSFLPKQVVSDNRVIPYQLYWYELNEILKNAENYLPFLSEKDSDGISVSYKIRSVFVFRVPYFVGPLNTHSENSWVVRKTGKIYPWNIEKVVDFDNSEVEFINKLIGRCTYLPGEKVLPKDSLLYHRFTVLNEINNLKIGDAPISVEQKQEIYNNVFLNRKKVSIKNLREYLVSHGYMSEDTKLSGVDNGDNIHTDLKPQHDFRHLISEGLITEADAEEIIVRITTSTDKPRLVKWLRANYPNLSEDDVKYVSRLKYKDFGRLSAKLLTGIEGMCRETGEVTTIIKAMWETNNNLMELLSDKYTFTDIINECAREYYEDNPRTVAERLDEMYVSNAVKRPIIRTLDIINDVRKAMGGYPEKIFIEMARGGTEEQKNKRTTSRVQQILDLYNKCEEDTSVLRKQLEEMGDAANSRLQSKALFLYYMQLGKCMYTGKPIELSKLSSGDYNIDHIYPQAYIKDDSILNNLVLVDSESNGAKSDEYPIDASIRKSMYGFWSMLRENNLITEEKYKRLTRQNGFSADEKWGFINRQLTETTQSTKAVATLLQEICPQSEIVYVKAKLSSEFRQEFGCLKSRTFNDLHHAKDAYLNIVTGNVYNSKFTKKWFMKHYGSPYSIRTDTLFTHKVECDEKVVWDGRPMLSKVKEIMAKNNANMTRYSFYRKSGQNGGFFDQMPLPKDEDGSKGLFPRKAGLDTSRYGGYRGLTVTGFMLVKYAVRKKTDILITSIPLISVGELSKGKDVAEAYIKSCVEEILGKKVDSISLPLGMRVLKINTMFSADGYRFCMSGSSGKGAKIIVYPMMPFDTDYYFNGYVKAMESISEKPKLIKGYVYEEAQETVKAGENLKLYDLYIEKLKNSIYSKRPNNALEILESGRDKFQELDVMKQVEVLLAIHTIFGRNTRGSDLTAINGKSKSAVPALSSNLSNWKKNYTDVRIIDSSATGIWEKRSENLLELL